MYGQNVALVLLLHSTQLYSSPTKQHGALLPAFLFFSLHAPTNLHLC